MGRIGGVITATAVALAATQIGCKDESGSAVGRTQADISDCPGRTNLPGNDGGACSFVYGSTCFESREAACNCAGCPDNCVVFESDPAEIRCRGDNSSAPDDPGRGVTDPAGPRPEE